jgi:hypothetical protein
VGYFIAAFDVATATGCCDGLADGSPPRFWTWHLSDAGEGRPRRLAYLRRFCDAYFAQQRVDEVIIELPLPIVVAARIGSDDNTQLLLRGGFGVVEACAAFAGVPLVRAVDIKAARGHLLGRRTFPAGEAKKATMRGCRALGWAVEDDNQADAGALWSLAVGEHNPRMAAATRAAHMGADDVPNAPRSTRKRRPRNAGLFDNG